MNILYHNRKRLARNEEREFGVKYVNLDQLFRKSDVLSIHVPYKNNTHEIVDLRLIKKMKNTAFLINTARGKIIKENDLIFALKKKIIAGAGLDVYQKEPINRKHHLVKMKNVVLTPHIGSSTIETRKKMAEIAVQNLILSLSGKKPVYEVKAKL